LSQTSALPLSALIRDRSRSMGIKLLVVSFLALLMAIPAIFVSSIVDERTDRAKDVMQEISSRVGGQQTFLGPVLSIPYSIPPSYKGAAAATGVYVVFPIEGDAALKVHTEERHRSLFKVPIFQADLKFDAAFDLSGVPSSAPSDAVLDWPHAEIVVGVSNAHGALADGTLMVDGKTVTFVPAENIGDINSQQRLPLTYLGVGATDVATPNATFRVSAFLARNGWLFWRLARPHTWSWTVIGRAPASMAPSRRQNEPSRRRASVENGWCHSSRAEFAPRAPIPRSVIWTAPLWESR
jgi:inner membrane protein